MRCRFDGEEEADVQFLGGGDAENAVAGSGDDDDDEKKAETGSAFFAIDFIPTNQQVEFLISVSQKKAADWTDATAPRHHASQP